MKTRKNNGLKKATAFFLSAACIVATLAVPNAVQAKEVTTEEVSESTTEESVTGTGRVVPHYTWKDDGGDWDGTHYTKDGNIMTDVFFCDNTYTYYLQKDGTPMKDRLTYHPDGEHVIYFDEYGHEVFNNFTHVKKSIAGDPVDDLCFFNVFGYMYVNNLTYDQAGTNLYYVNPYGVIERNGWFTFQPGIGGAAEALGVKAGDMGYANADGTLAVNCDMVDPNGNNVHLQGNGVAVETSLISQVDCKSAIEADVTLNGAGTGSHAKLVICSPTSAISYGLQYDACAVAPYTGKTMLMAENIASNYAGGQNYTRPGNIELALGQTYHLMLTLNEDGSGSFYLNNQKVGDYFNPSLAHQYVYLRVEASGRVNGDQVSATFNNIKCKNGEPYDPNKDWGFTNFSTNPTIQVIDTGSWKNIGFSGYVSGLGPGQDWDNAYESVSGIIQLSY